MSDCNLDENVDTSKSARYGNFSNYYNFNPAENRTKLFPNFIKYVKRDQNKITCLDVGCNSGELTQALYNHLMKRLTAEETEAVNLKILAIDLDQSLIEQAITANKNKQISFFCADVLNEDFRQIYEHFLKEHDQHMFDIVFCFSITMWIHINHGDEGLKVFLIRLSQIADLLLIEPQPWKCYGRAVRRMKRTNSEPFAEYSKIKIKKDVLSYIEMILTKECNFIKVLQTAPTSWGRQISFYKKIKARN